jgi:hypothetical protein
MIYVGWFTGNQEDALNHAKNRTKAAQRAFDQAGHRTTSSENQRHLREMQRRLSDAKRNEQRAQDAFDRNMRR